MLNIMENNLFWLAFQSLHPINESAPYDRRLIWAYDESQSLDSLKVPTSKELFGNDKNFSKMVSGLYSGGIKKVKSCNVVIVRQAQFLLQHIGMGLLR